MPDPFTAAWNEALTAIHAERDEHARELVREVVETIASQLGQAWPARGFDWGAIVDKRLAARREDHHEPDGNGKTPVTP